MADRALEKPLIFTPPHDEEPTRLFFWSNVREWAQNQVAGWREFCGRVDLEAGRAVDLETEWKIAVKMADEMIRGEISGEADAKIKAITQKVEEGDLIPATSVFGRYVRRLAETEGVVAVERVEAGPNAEGLDAHEVLWGPYRAPPLLELRISGYGRTLKFETWEGLQAWAESERDRWNQLMPLADVEPVVGMGVVKAHTEHFSGMAKTISRHLEEGTLEALCRDIAAPMGLIEEGRTLTLSGNRGRKLTRLFGENPAAALMAVATRRGGPVNVMLGNNEMDIAPLLRGYVDSRIDDIKPRAFLEGADAELIDFVDKWQTRQDLAHDRAEIIVVGHHAKRKQFTELAGQVIRKHRDEHGVEMGKLAHLRETYERDLQFKGPARYWRNKRLWHILGAVCAFVVFAVGAGITGWTLWEFKAEILALSQPAETTASAADTKVSNWQFGSLVLVTIPAVLVFWLLRLISRIFVMNLAGMSDAGHRATLISTFLAMTKSKDTNITPEERLLLIQGIFRAPGGAGDDAAPGAMLENIAKSILNRP